MRQNRIMASIIIVAALVHHAGSDIHIDFGYGLSRTLSKYYGTSLFGGLITGIRYDFAFRDSMLWDFGLCYVQRGGKDKASAYTFGTPATVVVRSEGWSVFEYDYLSLPILFKYRKWRTDAVRTSFFIGPRLDFRLNFRHWVEPSDKYVSDYCTLSEPAMNFLVFGIKTGIESEPFYRRGIGPTIRASCELDITSCTKSENNYTVRLALDFSGGISIRRKSTNDRMDNDK